MLTRWLYLGASLTTAFLSNGALAAELEPDLKPDSTVTPYLELAVENHPDVAAARAALEAERAAIPAASAWPDPVLATGIGLRPVETALGPQNLRLGLQMEIPFFGKRALRTERARHQARAAWHAYRARHLSVMADAAEAYYRYVELSRTTEIAEQNLTLLEGIEAVTRTRYRTGQAGQTDVLRLQVELGTVADRLRSLQEQQRPVSAQLRAALGVEPDFVLPWPVAWRELGLDIPPADEVLEAVRSQNDELRALRAAQEARRDASELAARDQFPNWTVGLESVRTGRSEFTNFDERGRDAWILHVRVPLPVFRSDDVAAVDQATAREREAAERTRATQLDRERTSELLLFQVRDATRQLELYDRSLIPTAEASFSTSLGAFRGGSAGLLDVLDAQRVLLRFQLDRIAAQSRRAIGLIRLWTQMGRVPPGVPDVPEDRS